jgi:retinol-binding protein 3
MVRYLAFALLGAVCVAGAPPAVAATPPPAASAAAVPAFDAAARARELDRIAALIEGHYVYKDKAAVIAAEVRGLTSDPELRAATDRSLWAAILTRRLGVHDLHFNVSWAPPQARGAPSLAAPGASDPGALERQMAGSNYGFDAVERLPGNIGYVRMSFFAPFDRAAAKTPGARRAGEAALALIENTDAVIFDVRRNGGGSPDMIDLLLTPFFGDKPVLLNRFYQREGDHSVGFTTLANFTGVRRPKTPVYVLISARTASAAEEFAYDVQTQKRGLIVGETSMGAANPGGDFDAGDGFSVFISTGAAVNPITGGNWERVGVNPDVVVPAADALARAQALALDQVVKTNASTSPTEARWTLDTLNAQAAGVRLDPARASEYVGDFADRTVAQRDGGLAYHRDRFPPAQLIPLGGDVFAVDGAPTTRISFERDAAGKVAVLVVANSDGGSSSFAKTP